MKINGLRMHFSIFGVLLIGSLSLKLVSCQNFKDDYYMKVEPNTEFHFTSPEYPGSVRSKNCRWFLETPYGYKFTIKCDVDVSWVSPLNLFQ